MEAFVFQDLMGTEDIHQKEAQEGLMENLSNILEMLLEERAFLKST